MTSARDMTVGVNLLWCLPGAVGGSEEYLVRQLIGLRDVAPEIRARLFVARPGSRPPTASWRPVRSSSWRRSTPAAAAGRVARRGDRGCRRALDGVDVVHHGGGTVPPRSPGPIVLTIHDLQYRTFPEYLSPAQAPVPAPHHAPVGEAGRRRRRAVASTCAARSSTPTGRDPDRVVVVPHGVDAPDRGRRRRRRAARRRYGLGDRRYVIYPALPTPTRTTPSCSTCWPGRGTIPTLRSCSSAAAGSSRTTSRRRSGGSA